VAVIAVQMSLPRSLQDAVYLRSHDAERFHDPLLSYALAENLAATDRLESR
jgi:hypothetical protein